MSEEKKSFDWSAKILRIKPVRCRINIRQTFRGHPTKSGVFERLNGLEVDLLVMWEMDEDDPYPGEYALSTPDSCKELFEKSKQQVSWIASGDVEVIGEVPQ